MKAKKPQVIKTSAGELERAREEIKKSSMPENVQNLMLAMMDAYLYLVQLYSAKQLTLNKVKRLFSFKTEKRSKRDDDDRPSGGSSDKQDGNAEEGGAENPPEEGGVSSGNERPVEEGRERPDDCPKKGPKGHGRNGCEDFPGAQRCTHRHEDLSPGDKCPVCGKGKLYPVKPAKSIVYEGAPPITATIHQYERFRCNACGKYFTAKGDSRAREKYTPAADVMIALYKYKMGVPFNRADGLQAQMEIPLPASTQWDRCEALVESVEPVRKYLEILAREAGLLYVDDTRNIILDLKKALRRENAERQGIFTTVILAEIGEHRITLFYTGNRHAGENLDALLAERESLKEVVLMGDALRHNEPKNAPVNIIRAKCMMHARREFWDLKDDYPSAAYPLSQIGLFYKNEKFCKQNGLGPGDRLAYHQESSHGPFKDIIAWGKEQFEQKKVEPNEELGKAIRYFDKHQEGLGMFLKRPGVPLDNGASERALKVPILNRKNAYFYKSAHGAHVGDTCTGLADTCHHEGVNVYKYFLALHENPRSVKSAPENWLPWNFTEN